MVSFPTLQASHHKVLSIMEASQQWEAIADLYKSIRGADFVKADKGILTLVLRAVQALKFKNYPGAAELMHELYEGLRGFKDLPERPPTLHAQKVAAGKLWKKEMGLKRSRGVVEQDTQGGEGEGDPEGGKESGTGTVRRGAWVRKEQGGSDSSGDESASVDGSEESVASLKAGRGVENRAERSSVAGEVEGRQTNHVRPPVVQTGEVASTRGFETGDSLRNGREHHGSSDFGYSEEKDVVTRSGQASREEPSSSKIGKRAEEKTAARESTSSLENMTSNFASVASESGSLNEMSQTRAHDDGASRGLGDKDAHKASQGNAAANGVVPSTSNVSEEERPPPRGPVESGTPGERYVAKLDDEDRVLEVLQLSAKQDEVLEGVVDSLD
jgi:hypothetical protein